MVARFIFTPFVAAAGCIETFGYLRRINVEFIAGWAKELVLEKL